MIQSTRKRNRNKDRAESNIYNVSFFGKREGWVTRMKALALERKTVLAKVSRQSFF